MPIAEKTIKFYKSSDGGIKMKHDSMVIAAISIMMIFGVLASDSGSRAESVDKTFTNSSELNAISFSNTKHTNFATEIQDKPKNDVSSNITKEMVAWEMIRLSWGVLVFGLVLILFIGAIAYKNNNGWDRELTRIFTVSLVIVAGLFLITAGYTDQQIAPMFGLLGTIAGYLLGKSTNQDQSTNQ
jgi:hypothetical protein